MRQLLQENVRDQNKKDVRRLNEAIHALSARVDLLAHENQGLQEALLHKKKRSKRGKPLDLQKRKEYLSGPVFWSPGKVREARVRRTVNEREKKELQLQKAEAAKLRKAAKLYNERIAQEKRIARAEAAEVKRKEKVEKAAKRARQKEARDAAKAVQLPQKGKRKASQAPIQKRKRQKRAGDAVGGVEAAKAPQAPIRHHITRPQHQASNLVRTRKLGGSQRWQFEDWMAVHTIFWFTLLILALNKIVYGGGSNFMTSEEQAVLTPKTKAERACTSKPRRTMADLANARPDSREQMGAGLRAGHDPNLFLGFVATEIALFTACRPFWGYWSVPALSTQCWSYWNFEYVEGVFNITADVAMLLVAIPIVAKVRLPLAQKAPILGIFGMGVFVVTAAVLTKVYCFVPSLLSYEYLNWYAREASIGVIVTNLPAVWSFLRDVFPELKRRGYRTASDSRSNTQGWGTSGGTRSNTRTADYDMQRMGIADLVKRSTSEERIITPSSGGFGGFGGFSGLKIEKHTTFNVEEDTRSDLELGLGLEHPLPARILVHEISDVHGGRSRTSTKVAEREIQVYEDIARALKRHSNREYVMRLKDVFYERERGRNYIYGTMDQVYLLYIPLAQGTLDELVLNKGLRTPSRETKLIFLYQLLQGLDAFHSACWLDRDLKPQNIGIVSIDPPKAVIIDLGQACFLGSRPGFPPAQDKLYGKPIDVWALGCVAYQMFLGPHPWREKKNQRREPVN
ncbi:hypothetical protein H2203_005144 [Taxawa tesnikishii (nom. ined.)]|nr:hypothetical protein H2203_005144 [Dothideales sp. JES 119]